MTATNFLSQELRPVNRPLSGGAWLSHMLSEVVWGPIEATVERKSVCCTKDRIHRPHCPSAANESEHAKDIHGCYKRPPCSGEALSRSRGSANLRGSLKRRWEDDTIQDGRADRVLHEAGTRTNQQRWRCGSLVHKKGRVVGEACAEANHRPQPV